MILERKADELHSEMKSGRGDGEDDDDDMVPLESVGKLQTTAEFDEVVIWGHEEMATASGDPYVRGMEEWIAVADKVRDQLILWKRLYANGGVDSRVRRAGGQVTSELRYHDKQHRSMPATGHRGESMSSLGR